MNKYRAFGLNIESYTEIPQIGAADFDVPDVRILPADLSTLTREEKRRTGEMSVYFTTEEKIAFRITNGDLIQVDNRSECGSSLVAVYLMGSCMGAILTQRGFMLLHGSCVTDGKRAILITGNSGAGKSTTAAEFLKRGWKLVTDDVTCVYDDNGRPMVRPSYPSQKLWRDAMDRYEKSGDDVHSLYFDKDREKFGVNVADSFFDGVCELSLVVRLLPVNRPCCIGPIEGMAKADQLMRNTYRMYMIEKKDQQRHFQRCVTLSTKVPMALLLRQKDVQCADTVYKLITDYLGGIEHD